MRIKSDQVFLGLAILLYAGLHVPNSWIENSGFASMIAMLLLVLLFWTLVIRVVFRVVYLVFFVKGWPWYSWIYTLLTALLIAVTYFGITIKSHEPKPVALSAYAEGSASCGESLLLLEDDSFEFQAVCFGVSTTKGSYLWSQDTVYFHDVTLGVRKTMFPNYGWLNDDSSQVIIPFIRDSAEVRLLKMDVTGGSLFEE